MVESQCGFVLLPNYAFCDLLNCACQIWLAKIYVDCFLCGSSQEYTSSPLTGLTNHITDKEAWAIFSSRASKAALFVISSVVLTKHTRSVLTLPTTQVTEVYRRHYKHDALFGLSKTHSANFFRVLIEHMPQWLPTTICVFLASQNPFGSFLGGAESKCNPISWHGSKKFMVFPKRMLVLSLRF